MISVNDAKAIVAESIDILPATTLFVGEATGYVLAEDVFSLIDFPPFDQSSVDGYAIAFDDRHKKLLVQGETRAGSPENFSLPPGHAVRIFTGAPVPGNADTVVMQEKGIRKNGELTVHDDKLTKGMNFRPRATDMKRGALALKKDDLLTPGAVGFLAALGVTGVSVCRKPTVTIIITGDELRQPGKDLEHGQVYEANSLLLKAALTQLHFHELTFYHVPDNLEQLTTTLSRVLQNSDMVLLCGGASAGDYDFVSRSAKSCGVKELFHGVRQKPGKPLYFGLIDKKPVFGLPGNPSAALTCFYEYVQPALERMINRKKFLETIHAKMAAGYKKAPGLVFFLKGLRENDIVWPLDAQESYRLSSYAKANCLVVLDENATEYNKGDFVEVHILPN